MLSKVWHPYFGIELSNRINLPEKTFPYILRHTQMRPRQLIMLCNNIARLAIKRGRFPNFSAKDIIEGIKNTELALAIEVINSFAKTYGNIDRILYALNGLPVRFKGNILDKVARKTASAWQKGEYSSGRFKQIVTELGVVGRVRQVDEKTRITEADFSYNLEDRLFLAESDDCIIHPMFFRKFNIKNEERLLVYPFPDHPDYQMQKD